MKCKLDHEHELELVCMEHMNEVHRLKARITRAVHEFYRGPTPKACGESIFVPADHGRPCWRFKGVRPRSTPPRLHYDTNGNVIVGVLSRKPTASETMTWDMEQILDVKSSSRRLNLRASSKNQ